MALTGNNNEEKIWNYLIDKIQNPYGVAGLMGNLYAESGLRPENLQNSYEKSLGMTDIAYTIAVDNGSYKNFIRDKAGYGLAQWTFWTRKEKMYNYIKTRGKSIGDLEAQLDYLMEELTTAYPTILNTLRNAKSLLEASNVVLLQFERPQDQSINMQNKRAGFGQVYLDKYGKNTKAEQINIIQRTSTHNTTQKQRNIEYIVLHYTAGTTSAQGSAQNTATYFMKTTNQASADFIVDDVEIVQYNPDPKNYYCWAVGGNAYSNNICSIAKTMLSKCKNNNSISIEMCSNKKNTNSLTVTDDDWYLTDATINNAVKLTKYLMKLYNIDINHVITHCHVTGKCCPQPWVKNENALVNWQAFLEKVAGTAVPIENKVETKPQEVIKGGTPCNYTIRVTADSLNVRTGPGTMYSIVRTVSKPSIYTIVAEQSGFGFLKSQIGWICLDYTEKYDAQAQTPQPAPAPFLVRVTADNLNVRSGPGTNYSIVQQVHRPSVYTIVEQIGDWGRLKSGRGYINLKYTQKL